MTKKKLFKFKIKKNLLNKSTLIFGNFGMKTISKGLIHPNNIENLRRKLSKQFKRIQNKNTKTKLFFNLCKWKSVTKKPMLSRMGQGAGSIYKWNLFFNQGVLFIEILTEQPIDVVFPIYKRAIKSFPLKLKFIYKKL